MIPAEVEKKLVALVVARDEREGAKNHRRLTETFDRRGESRGDGEVNGNFWCVSHSGATLRDDRRVGREAVNSR